MKKRIRTAVVLAAVAGLLLILVYFYTRFTRNVAVEYSDPVEHFKYGSMGGEILTGIPYSVWMTMPRIFGLPGGNYESFGFIYERGKELPVGVSKRNYQGIERVSFNCAICHLRVGPGRAGRSAAPHPWNALEYRGPAGVLPVSV